MNIKLPSFADVWKTFERCGYKYSPGNIAKVAFGYRIAQDFVDRIAPPASDNEARAIQALRETQNACDVSQCPWCGVWGQNYSESDQPIAYCHHEYSLRPWQALHTAIEPLRWVPDEPLDTHRVHELKCDRDVFDAVWHGYKTCEVRYNDRAFERGDTLDLRETQWTGAQMKTGCPLIYTGRRLTKRVAHVLSGYGLQEGWVILSFNDFVKYGDINKEKTE